MPYNKSKCLKWQKIGIVALAVMTMLSVCASAVYTSGDYNTPRYSAPLRFDFQIFGTTAQLTPTITYQSGQSLTYDTYEKATQSNAVVTSVNRTNFGVSLVGNTSIDVRYRLSFDVARSVDTFTLKITAPLGVYDFDKYGIPQIAIPTGYDVNVKTSYNMRFANAQTYTSDLALYVQRTYSATQNDNIKLIFDTWTIADEEHAIEGGVLIDKYVTEITFTPRSEGGVNDGVSGYYLWNTVLNVNGYDFIDVIGNEVTIPLAQNTVRLIGTNDGVVDTIVVNAIHFTSGGFNGDTAIELFYELDPDGFVLAYDGLNEVWVGATRDDDAIDIDILTPEQMRMLVFNVSVNEALMLSSLSGMELQTAEHFKTFLLGETTYYSTNPLTLTINDDGQTYSFTDGDGGMYLHYYADRMLGEEYSSTLGDWYQRGYLNGFGGGGEFNGDYGTFLANAVGGFLDFALFPNFTLGGVLGVILALGLLMMFIKFFAGG